jgi:hypothetical protein
VAIQTRIQSLQLPTAGLRPAVGARLSGTLYVNLPDFQFGVVDPVKTPIDLLAVRFFSSLGHYVIGQYVWNGGFLYRCVQAVAPGPFLPSQWAQVFTATDVVGVYMPISGGTFTGAIHAPSGSTIVGYMPTTGGAFTGPVTLPPGSSVAGYMPVTGGVFTGPIVTTGGSTITGYMPVTGGTFTGPINTPAGSTIPGYLPLSGGQMSGILTLSDNPSGIMDAATKQYVDSFLGAGGGPPGTGEFVPLAGGVMTGPLTMNESGIGLFGASGSSSRAVSGFTGSPSDTTNRRWDLVVGTNLAETGANAGSNFGVVAYDDNGAQLSSWNTNRASGRLTFNGVNAAPHTVTAYPPDIGSATIVLNRQGSGHNCGIVASSGGLNRWALALSDAVPETGGNSGSNFTIQAVADDGHTALAELDINRMSGRMTLNGAGAAPHTIVAYPPDVGSATLVLNRTGPGHNCGMVASSGGLNRWNIALSDVTPEAGGNSGSNFDITASADDGNTKLANLNINRANGRVSINGVGATPRSLTTYPPQVGNANLVLNSKGTTSDSITASNNGLNRWQMVMNDGTPETGGNNGANFNLSSFNDAGAFLNVVMSAKRSNGQATFPVPIVNGSDRRSKSAIEPIAHALDLVMRLTGVTYERNGECKREMGLIAQDVAPVVPEVVYEAGPTIDDAEPMLGIAYGNIVAVLIEAIKELSVKVSVLEARPA